MLQRNAEEVNIIIPNCGLEHLPIDQFLTMGPGPFAVGIEGAARRAFADLARRFEK